MAGSPDCIECQLEEVLKARFGEIRHELRMMNPTIDPNYDRVYQALIYVDTDLRMLKGEARKADR